MRGETGGDHVYRNGEAPSGRHDGSYLTTTDGKEVTGKLDDVSGASVRLLLRDAATREFSEADVARITAKDTLWSGLLIGAGLGAAFGFMLNDESCIHPYATADCRKVSRSAGAAATAGLGAALGAAPWMHCTINGCFGHANRRGIAVNRASHHAESGGDWRVRVFLKTLQGCAV